VSQREPAALAGAGRRSIGRAEEPSGTTKLARLREENARRDRLTAGLRELCGLGRRAVVEFILDFAAGTGAIELLSSAPRSTTPDLIARCSLSRLAIDSRHRVSTPSGANSDAPVEQPRLLPHHEGEHDARLRQASARGASSAGGCRRQLGAATNPHEFPPWLPGISRRRRDRLDDHPLECGGDCQKGRAAQPGRRPYQGFQSAKPLEPANAPKAAMRPARATADRFNEMVIALMRAADPTFLDGGES